MEFTEIGNDTLCDTIAEGILNPKREIRNKHEIQNQNNQNVLIFENYNFEFVSIFDIRISNLQIKGGESLWQK